MENSYQYQTPLGAVTLSSNGSALTGLWFTDRPHTDSKLFRPIADYVEDPILREAVLWLDAYWQKRRPSPTALPIVLEGSDFQKKVWQLLLQIPYGSCVSYGELKQEYCAASGSTAMSAQAIGGAVARNPVSIIVPCHRVIGSNGSMTGYSGGIQRKIALLSHEGFPIPCA